MKRDKVAIFRANLLPISETFIRDQANALTEWEPILLGRKNAENGLATHNLQREIVPEHGNRLSHIFRFLQWAPEPNLTNRLKRLDIRLVHAHFGTNAAQIWPSVKAAGLPMLVTLHGYDININKEWWEAGHGGLSGRVYPRRLLKMANDPAVKFIAVSNAIKQRAIEYGIPEDKITASYIGVDTQRFKPDGLPILQRKKRILFVGRMVEKKAPTLMIRTYAEVLKKAPDAELVMIGAGPLLAASQRLAQELSVDVNFLGAKSSDEVLEQLHQSRALCLPSVTAKNGDAEGFGMVILEAQSCGVPVVTSARGGGSEGICNDVTGYSFTEGDAKQAATQLIKILSNDELTSKLSASAVGFVQKRFEISGCTKKLEAVYQSFASGESCK